MPQIATVRAAAIVDRPQGFKFTARGLVVMRELSSAEYDQVGRRIGSIVNGANWAVGDWLQYGESQGYPGAKYSRAQELTGLTYDVLSQAARVAAAYLIDHRVAGVSWTHHRAALTLPLGERVKVLERAAREQWTAAMLQQFVVERQLAMARGIPLAQIPSPPRDVPHLKAVTAGWRRNVSRRRVIRVCPNCGHRWDIRSTENR